MSQLQGLKLTPRLNRWGECELVLGPRDRAVREIRVVERGIRVFDDEALIFNGLVWAEPEFGPDGVIVRARDPLAVFEWRRVRAVGEQGVTPYEDADAGAIAHDRVNVQNGYSRTMLRPGRLDVSVSRDRTYLPGKRELELINELAHVRQGFFYRTSPVEDDPDAMAELDILYPDAGVTRPEVRLEYGEGTIGNLDDYRLRRGLPLNRVTAASAAEVAGRIASTAIDSPSISRGIMLEDELVFLDVTDAATLEQYAEGPLLPVSPRVYQLTPGPEAPLPYRRFLPGDFVRLQIRDAHVDVLAWVRVLEPVLEVDASGLPRLGAIAVEEVTGNPAKPPELAFREALERERSAREALERRVERIAFTDAASPAEGDPDPPPPPPPPPDAPEPPPDSPPPPPADDPAAPPPPPPAPPAPPSLAGLEVVAIAGNLIRASVQANGNGSPTHVWFTVVGVKQTPAVEIGTGAAHVQQAIDGLSPNTTYNVTASAQSAAGLASTGPVQVTTGGFDIA